jgi:outer membrane biosynthesis protein TonB
MMKNRFTPLTMLALFISLTVALAGCQSAEAPAPEPPPAPAPPAEAAAPPQVEPVVLSVTSRVLNLREEASAKSASLGQLKKGDKVVLAEERGGWVRVKLPDSRIGWVDARYVRKGAEPCLPDRPYAVASEPPFRMGADGPHGRVVVEGEVGPDGVVKKTKVVSNGSGNAELAARAEGELKQMKFVAPVRNCRVQTFIYTYARNF